MQKVVLYCDSWLLYEMYPVRLDPIYRYLYAEAANALDQDAERDKREKGRSSGRER